MSDFQEILVAFTHGKIEFDELLETIDRTLASRPDSIPELLEALETANRSGRLPPQIYALIQTKAQQSQSVEGREYAPEPALPTSKTTDDSSDHTRLATPPPGTNMPEPDEKSKPEDRFTASKPDDKTRIVSHPTGLPASPGSVLEGQQPEPEDRTRIAAGPPESADIQRESDDATRILPSRAAATAPPSETKDGTRILSRPTGMQGTLSKSPPTGTASTPDDHTRVTSKPSELSDTGRSRPRSGSSGSWSRTGTHTATRNLSHEPSVGDVLNNRFVLDELIGRGGMGIVFKALDKRKIEARDRQPHVALKLLNESSKQHDASLMALQREARKAQKLQHRNVISVFDFDRDEYGNYFITMELLDGSPLDETIKQLKGIGMPTERALPMIIQMGEALAAAHHQKPGVIHSDFKPGNVFLSSDDHIKVFDFGIARAAKPKELDSGADETAFDAQTLGALTPTYASLEMIQGMEPDPRDDIYALAIVAYELLTGKRPFGRTPADKALKEGLTPIRVKGLTRRQWNGLQRGLAFHREDRSPTVEAFLEEMRFRKSRLPLALTIGAIGLGGAFYFSYPIIDERIKVEELEELIQNARPIALVDILERINNEKPGVREKTRPLAIRRLLDSLETASAKPEQFEAILKSLEGDRELLAEIATTAKDIILEHYLDQADVAFFPQERRYNYNLAKGLLDSANTLYPDSFKVIKEQDDNEKAKNELLNRQDTRFNQLLENRQLNQPDWESQIAEILNVVSLLDTNHELLKDPRLATSYDERALAARDQGDLDEATRYIDAGLNRFPENSELSNTKTSIQIARENAAAQVQIVQLRQTIEQRLPKLRTPDDYLALAPDLRRLSSRQPEDPLLEQAEQGLRPLLKERIDGLIESYDWLEAEQQLEAFSNQLAAAYQNTLQNRITAARDAHIQKVSSLFENLYLAISERRLTRPAGDNAREILDRARYLAPDDPRLAQGLASIAQTYLELAREARSEKKWDLSRQYVQDGLALNSTDPVTGSLRAELRFIEVAEEESNQQLEQAEREKLAQQRKARIDTIQQQFEQQLEQMTLSEQGGRKVLEKLDQLAAVDPKNPLVDGGRKRIALRFDSAGQSLGERRQWSKAMNLVREGIKITPESSLLSERLVRLQLAYSEQQAAERGQDILARKTNIETLLAAPLFTSDWETQVLNELDNLGGLLTTESSWLTRTLNRFGSLYLEQASRERSKRQFAQARQLLDKGQKLVPGMSDTFNRELASLIVAERAWDRENKEQIRRDRIEGMKKSLTRQAKADETSAAIKTLESLRSELPANDPFIHTTGPEAIGNAFLRLAKSRVSRRNKDYPGAIRLLEKGLDIAPNMVSLRQTLNDLQRIKQFNTIRDQVRTSNFRDLSKLKIKLQKLRNEYPDYYPDLSRGFAEILAVRVEKTKDYQQAQRLLEIASSLFPNSRRLQDIVLEKPAKPSLIARKGIDAVKTGHLTAAGKLLQEAKNKEPGHPDLAKFERVLSEKTKRAENLYRQHDRPLKAKQYKEARTLVKQAIALWKDNVDYPKRLKTIEDLIRSSVAGSRVTDPCRRKYAGYGKRSRNYRCSDVLSGGKKGPIMVIIPAGGGQSSPYAIGRYEITIGNYNSYCRLSGNCRPVSGSSTLPITNISSGTVQKYARWLPEIRF
ncbi:MAG: protein kinase [Gammaproteobacteria bacterium]|nr:protein kinase [Gammaproteobacteria bacterium]